jgi:hypothetical protein
MMQAVRPDPRWAHALHTPLWQKATSREESDGVAQIGHWSRHSSEIAAYGRAFSDGTLHLSPANRTPSPPHSIDGRRTPSVGFFLSIPDSRLGNLHSTTFERGPSRFCSSQPERRHRRFLRSRTGTWTRFRISSGRKLARLPCGVATSTGSSSSGGTTRLRRSSAIRARSSISTAPGSASRWATIRRSCPRSQPE